MKYPTLVLATLLTAFSVDVAVVKAENVAQVQPDEPILLAGRHRRGGFKHRRRIYPRRFRRFPHRNFRHRNFRSFPGRSHHRSIHRRRFGRRFYPSFRHYPQYRRRYRHYSPYYYPSSRRLFLYRSTFPGRRSYIAPEHIGPEGQYDHQGLAKRVILGMVADPALKPLLATLDIQQQGDKVLLSGEVPEQGALDKMVELVKNTKGARTVDITEVVVLSESESEGG
ncbi:BON domain-containing protein [Acaryochloris sp. IP29b_bin.148]|uniref:BON domain-containing protein n=1 Tax=Acaryochloris sp. IP29b_bin.148 TaxID=2969218 RepID=UPI002603A3E1|nr:BON domain-containing protein [Acaryochloris sp. IP29b_bin.148]